MFGVAFRSGLELKSSTATSDADNNKYTHRQCVDDINMVFKCLHNAEVCERVAACVRLKSIQSNMNTVLVRWTHSSHVDVTILKRSGAQHTFHLYAMSTFNAYLACRSMGSNEIVWTINAKYFGTYITRNRSFATHCSRLRMCTDMNTILFSLRQTTPSECFSFNGQHTRKLFV